MNIGTTVLEALAPTFGATVRFRRNVQAERKDGGVNLVPERIADVADDLAVILLPITQRKAAQLFGADSPARTVAMVTTELAALLVDSSDQMKVVGSPDELMVGRVFQLVGRDVTVAGSLGGVVQLGLFAAGQSAIGVWD